MFDRNLNTPLVQLLTSVLQNECVIVGNLNNEIKIGKSTADCVKRLQVRFQRTFSKR